MSVTRAVDVLFDGGTVIDGTGAPGLRARVAVAGDEIVLPAGDDVVEAARTIDATGLVIAPGFIDLHSHGGLMMLADPRHEPKVRQGVTTEVIGVDGNAYAPFPDPDDLRDFVVLNGGLDGRPDIAYDWATVAGYLARYDRRVAVNVAYVVGNSPLRIAALGWDEVEADDRAIADQRARLREAMEDGAFGMSTGLDYPPGAYATTAELAAIAGEAARLGGIYHTHVRYPLGDGFLDPFREAIEIGRRSGVAVHLTHFYHRETFPGTPDQMLALVDDAQAEGLDVSFDLYPSEWASTRLLIMLPTWIQAGGIGPLRERLADRSVRTRIRDELAARGRMFAGDRAWDELRVGAFTRPEHPRVGRADAGRRHARDRPGPRGHDLRPPPCRGPAGQPGDPRARIAAGSGGSSSTLGSMIGTDGVLVGAKPAPRTYGTYPEVLGQLVREERWLGLEAAIHRMTGAPAARLGLADRGRIADGLAADLVLFDPATVRSNATYDDPRQFPDGIPMVLVNGVPVVDGGEHTGATPGRALRRGRVP